MSMSKLLTASLCVLALAAISAPTMADTMSDRFTIKAPTGGMYGEWNIPESAEPQEFTLDGAPANPSMLNHITLVKEEGSTGLISDYYGVKDVPGRGPMIFAWSGDEYGITQPP